MDSSDTKWTMFAAIAHAISGFLHLMAIVADGKKGGA